MKIFVCFNVGGAGDIANHIYNEYTKRGIEVFVSSQYKSINLGDEWLHNVKRAISNCDVFLIIVTKEGF